MQAAVAALVGLLALAEVWQVRLMYYFIGFPDGYKNGLDRLREVTYPVFVAVAVLFAIVAFRLAWRLAKGRAAGWRTVGRLALGLLLLDAAAFAVDAICEAVRPPEAEIGQLASPHCFSLRDFVSSRSAHGNAERHQISLCGARLARSASVPTRSM